MAEGDLHITRDYDKGTIAVGEELARVILVEGGEVVAQVVVIVGPVSAKLPPAGPPPRQ